jgi:uncharacterized protein (TIGR02145 family)
MKNLFIIICFSFIQYSEAQTTFQKTIKDVDDNYYETVNIGNRVWMAENLRTTKLNDSTEISYIIDNRLWIESIKPSYCYYHNDKTKYETNYGSLYNAFAVNTGKLCPSGWHVPSTKEFEVLKTQVTYDDLIIGGNSELNIIINGYRKEDGTFSSDECTSLWTSNINNNMNNTLVIGTMDFVYAKVVGAMIGGQEFNEGVAVRCIENMDNEYFIGSWEEYKQKGITCYTSGDYTAAINYLSKSIEKKIDEYEPYYYLGLINLENNDYEIAINNFSKSIEYNPNFSLVYFSRGLAYAEIKKYELAVIDFTNSIKLDPNYASSYIERCIAYEKIGKTKEANKDRIKYNELKPTDK